MAIRMAYEVVMSYHLHMPSYFLGTFTEYPSCMLYISLSVYATGGVFRKKNTAVPISIIPNTP